MVKYKDGHTEEIILDCTCRLPKTLKNVFMDKQRVDAVILTEL